MNKRMYSPIRGGSVSPIARAHTPTASDFPVPATQEFKVTKRDKGLVSPSQSSFSFIDEEEQPVRAITSPRRIESRTPSRAPSRGPSRKNSVDLSRARGASIDGAAGYLCQGVADDVVVQAEPPGKTRTQFYTEVFAYREPNITPKDRIYSDAIVTVEIKTNVIVHDEYAFLQDLSQQLSQRYQRPTTSIFLSLSHSACMLFGGTFDSAYILTITTLPSLLLPTTNKRNSALLQAFLADSLGVSPARGLVRFLAVPDEFLAFNGTTVLGQIDNLKREEVEKERERVRKENVNHMAKATGRKCEGKKQYKMVPSHCHSSAGGAAAAAWNGSQSVPVSRGASPPPPPQSAGGILLPGIPLGKGGWIEKGGWGEKEKKPGRLGKRKSFFNIFGGGGRRDV